MSRLSGCRLPVCAALLLSATLPTAVGYPAAAAERHSRLPTLSAEQQRAVGIVIAPAAQATAPQRIDAYGRVLDPSRLVADAGRLAVTRAVAAEATAESTRLQRLYRGANASLKALQAAEAAQTEARVRAREARMQFLLRWKPLTRLSPARRARLIEGVAAGRRLLLRADLPGRHSLGTLPKRALVDVDGVEWPARVLGLLPRASAPLQSVGLLLQIAQPPPGLGPGAQLPVRLEGPRQVGRMVPDGSLLYGKRGAYVYCALPEVTKHGSTRFAPLPVTPLQAIGGAWLVSGLHANDRIVVQGAGVLWSLQGLGRIGGGDD